MNILNSELKVINMGLKSFSENLSQENVPVVNMDWAPPCAGNKEMLSLLERYNDYLKKINPDHTGGIHA